MPFFDVISPPLEQGIEFQSYILPEWKTPKEKLYSVLRMQLIQVTEEYSVHCSHACAEQLTDPEIKRNLALIRRADQRQWMNYSANSAFISKLSCEEKLGNTFLLQIMACAFFAQHLENSDFRDGLDFILPEYQDMLYRLVNLMYWKGKEDPEQYYSAAEIMPGRPMVACNRHPYDDVGLALNETGFDQLLPLVVMIALADSAAEDIRSCSDQAREQTEKKLFIEMEMIMEQHRSFLRSFLPMITPFEKMMLCHYAECYVYSSMHHYEEKEELAARYWEEMQHEISHMKKIAGIMKAENLNLPFIPDFPAQILLQPQKGYVRDALMNIGVTLRRGKIIPVGDLKKGADFFRYQKRMCNSPEKQASHQVIERNIERFGMEYRYEIAPHPIEMMRNREKDALDPGR